MAENTDALLQQLAEDNKFDVGGALKEGYSKQEIIDHLKDLDTKRKASSTTGQADNMVLDMRQKPQPGLNTGAAPLFAGGPEAMPPMTSDEASRAAAVGSGALAGGPLGAGISAATAANRPAETTGANTGLALLNLLTGGKMSMATPAAGALTGLAQTLAGLAGTKTVEAAKSGDASKLLPNRGDILPTIAGPTLGGFLGGISSAATNGPTSRFLNWVKGLGGNAETPEEAIGSLASKAHPNPAAAPAELAAAEKQAQEAAKLDAYWSKVAERNRPGQPGASKTTYKDAKGWVADAKKAGQEAADTIERTQTGLTARDVMTRAWDADKGYLDAGKVQDLFADPKNVTALEKVYGPGASQKMASIAAASKALQESSAWNSMTGRLGGLGAGLGIGDVLLSLFRGHASVPGMVASVASAGLGGINWPKLIDSAMKDPTARATLLKAAKDLTPASMNALINSGYTR